MAPILYMTPLSPPSRSVLITAEFLGIELELKNVDLTTGQNRKTEYLTLNPLHTVPTLVDDHVTIIDSHAINAYLVRKYGKNDNLYPKDFEQRAMVDQRLHFDSGRLFDLFRNAVVPIFYRKRKDVAEEQANKILEIYKVIEGFLEKSLWIATNEITIADFHMVTSVTALDLLIPLDSAKFPKIQNWIQRFQDLKLAKVNEPGQQILKSVIEECRK